MERIIDCFSWCSAHENDKITLLIIGKTRCFKQDEFEEIILPSFKEVLDSIKKL